MGAGIFHCKLSENSDDELCDIQTAYFFACVLQENHNGSMFSSTESSMKNFISQSVISCVRTNGMIEAQRRINSVKIVRIPIS